MYWINKNDPLGPRPSNPESDPQYSNWEYGVQNWVMNHSQNFAVKPATYDTTHTEANKPRVVIISPNAGASYGKDARVTAVFQASGNYPIVKASFYLNGDLVGTSDTSPFTLSFIPSSSNFLLSGINQFKVVVYDSVYNQGEATVPININ